MIKLIESLKEGKHNPENLTFLNMKKYGIYKNNPYMSNGLEIFAIEKEISLEDKIKIIDIFDNNIATYMLNIINKWDDEKDSLPKDKWDNIKTVSVKAWIKRNDPLNKIDTEFKIGKYYLFERRFESLNIKCPSTEYGYSMEYTGEYIVNQWFHNLCMILYKEELKWFKENNPLQIKINKVKKLGNSYGVVFNCKLLNDIIYNQEENVTEEQIDVFLSAYEAIKKCVAEQTEVISNSLDEDIMYQRLNCKQRG